MNKDRQRMLKARLKRIFNIPHFESWIIPEKYPKLPNFWYDPFEVYVQAHIKRAWYFLTCDEFNRKYFSLDEISWVLNTIHKWEDDSNPFKKFKPSVDNYYIGDITMTSINDKLYVKKIDGEVEVY
jgi:hypothetical protein